MWVQKRGVRWGNPAVNSFVLKHKDNLPLVLAAIYEEEFMFNYEMADKLGKLGLYKDVDLEKGITKDDIYKMLDRIPSLDISLRKDTLPFVVRYYALEKGKEKAASLIKKRTFGLKDIFKIIPQSLKLVSLGKSVYAETEAFPQTSFSSLASVGESLLERVKARFLNWDRSILSTEESTVAKEEAQIEAINMGKAASVVEPDLPVSLYPDYSRPIQKLIEEKIDNPIAIALALHNPFLFDLRLNQMKQSKKNVSKFFKSRLSSSQDLKFDLTDKKIKNISAETSRIDLGIELETLYSPNTGISPKTGVYQSRLRSTSAGIIGGVLVTVKEEKKNSSNTNTFFNFMSSAFAAEKSDAPATEKSGTPKSKFQATVKVIEFFRGPEESTFIIHFPSGDSLRVGPDLTGGLREAIASYGKREEDLRAEREKLQKSVEEIAKKLNADEEGKELYQRLAQSAQKGAEYVEQFKSLQEKYASGSINYSQYQEEYKALSEAYQVYLNESADLRKAYEEWLKNKQALTYQEFESASYKLNNLTSEIDKTLKDRIFLQNLQSNLLSGNPSAGINSITALTGEADKALKNIINEKAPIKEGGLSLPDQMRLQKYDSSTSSGTRVEIPSPKEKEGENPAKLFRFNPYTGKPEIKLRTLYGVDIYMDTDFKINGNLPLSKVPLIGSYTGKILPQAQLYFDSDGNVMLGISIRNKGEIIGGVAISGDGEISGSIDIGKALSLSKSYVILSISSSGIEGATIPFGHWYGAPFALGINKDGRLSLSTFVKVSFLPVPIPIGLTTNEKGEPVLRWPGGSLNLGKLFGIRSKDQRPRVKPSPRILADGSLDFGSYWYETCHRHLTGKDCVWNEVRSENPKEQLQRAKIIYDVYKGLTGCPPDEKSFFDLYFHSGTPHANTFLADQPYLKERAIKKVVSTKSNKCKKDNSTLGYSCSIKSTNAGMCEEEGFDFKSFIESLGGKFREEDFIDFNEPEGETPTPPTTPQTPTTPATPTQPETPSTPSSPATSLVPSVPTSEAEGTARVGGAFKGPAFLVATGTALGGIVLLTILVVVLFYISKSLKKRRTHKIDIFQGDTSSDGDNSFI